MSFGRVKVFGESDERVFLGNHDDLHWSQNGGLFVFHNKTRRSFEVLLVQYVDDMGKYLIEDMEIESNPESLHWVDWKSVKSSIGFKETDYGDPVQRSLALALGAMNYYGHEGFGGGSNGWYERQLKDVKRLLRKRGVPSRVIQEKTHT